MASIPLVNSSESFNMNSHKVACFVGELSQADPELALKADISGLRKHEKSSWLNNESVASIHSLAAFLPPELNLKT